MPAILRLTHHGTWPEVVGRMGSIIGTAPAGVRKPTPALNTHLTELALHDLHANAKFVELIDATSSAARDGLGVTTQPVLADGLNALAHANRLCCEVGSSPTIALGWGES